MGIGPGRAGRADIVRQAVAGARGTDWGNIEHPTSNIQRRREKSPGDFAELEKRRASSEHENEKNHPWAPGNFGKTKTCRSGTSAERRHSVAPRKHRRRSPRRRYASRTICSTLPTHPSFILISARRRIRLQPPGTSPRQNRRGCNHPCQLLHHSPHARLASQPAAGRHRSPKRRRCSDGVKELT